MSFRIGDAVTTDPTHEPRWDGTVVDIVRSQVGSALCAGVLALSAGQGERSPRPRINEGGLMSTRVAVAKIPDCDICKHAYGKTVPAYADARLDIGSWANVCKEHFDAHKCSLGTGRGQELVQA